MRTLPLIVCHGLYRQTVFNMPVNITIRVWFRKMAAGDGRDGGERHF
ncbi:MAG: hypothetical protein QNJ61_16700 [Desulfobacterales bacterium]|nr:hypothetical protein [Desulfobacterales bacterium]